MKLLQINDTMWINAYNIEAIDEIDPTCCRITSISGMEYFCDRYTAQQLMSIICEEVYYGDDGICKEDKWWNQESKD